MGNKLLYYLVVKPISMLPFSILYLFSDGLKFILYRVVKYRRKVVTENIKNSFPEKSDAEIAEIEKKFYSHFTDLLVESVKMFSVSESEIKKRMVSMNSEIFDRFYKEGKDVVLVSGHYGNWEMWASGGAYHMPHDPRGVYKPLNNKFWDNKAKKSRGRFGMNLIPTKDASAQFGLTNEPCALVLMIDQSPARTKKCYWTTFLNQETPINFGMESLSSKYNAPVIFGCIQKVKRGYFEVTWTLVSDKPQEEPYGLMTERATKILEEKIQEQPHLWLWTHKRWKRKRKDDEKIYNALEKYESV